ncbi:hypothetical protein TELCIR_19761, partial [Teladorsagia circumcincta]
ANGGLYCGMLNPTTAGTPTTAQSTTVIPTTKTTTAETTEAMTTTAETTEATTLTTEPQTTTEFTTTQMMTTANVSEPLRFDILFLVDVSKEAKDRLGNMNSFATSLMSAYDVSQQNTRVALIAVGSGQSSTIPVAYFDTIDTYQTLLMYIKFIEEFADFEHDGQAIEK